MKAKSNFLPILRQFGKL